jgi:DNA-binding transcriptional LysR family regulator
MRQDDLDGLIAFVAVADERGFTSAAARLGVSPSAVSQTIRNLERRLGAALFNRTTRSVGLTEAGARYLERVRPALLDLSTAAGDLDAQTSQPTGVLRINVPRAGHLIVLQPILGRFLQAYPSINLEIHLDNHLVDIVAQGFDAGIRFGEFVQKDMVGIKVGPDMTAHVVASPEYLAQRGVPLHPQDLVHHDCIAFRHNTSGQIERWEFSRDGERFDHVPRGRLILNDSEALVSAAMDGLGIAYMINGYIEGYLAQGSLVRILEGWSPAFPALYLYYADRRRVPPKLRALIDFIRDNPQPAG